MPTELADGLGVESLPRHCCRYAPQSVARDTDAGVLIDVTIPFFFGGQPAGKWLSRWFLRAARSQSLAPQGLGGSLLARPYKRGGRAVKKNWALLAPKNHSFLIADVYQFNSESFRNGPGTRYRCTPCFNTLQTALVIVELGGLHGGGT
jgi:hypothetical protein